MTQAVAKKDKAATLLAFIGARKSHIEKAMSELARRVLPPARICDLLNVALTRNPDLLDCTLESVFFAVQKAAECGLDFTGKGGQGWLIPFKNGRTGLKEAVFVPGYKGLRLNLIRSQTCQRIVSRVVYDGDQFSYSYGLADELNHAPKGTPSDDPKAVWAAITHAYCVAYFREGPPQFVVMDKMELMRVRNSSKGKDRPDSEWQVWPDLACAKTAVRRLANQLDVDPNSLALLTLEADTQAETGQSAPGSVPSHAPAIAAPETASQTERLKAEMKEEKEPPGEQAPEEPETEAEPSEPPEGEAPSEPETPGQDQAPPEEEIAPPANRTPKKPREAPTGEAIVLPAGKLGERLAEVVARLEKHGVTIQDIEKFQDCNLAEMTEGQVTRLGNLTEAVENGDLTWKGIQQVKTGSATKKGGQ